jgi:DnaJ-class molecular chaperone
MSNAHEYEGGRKKKEYIQPLVCPHCHGKGCKPEGDYNDVVTCKECKGNGIKWG